MGLVILELLHKYSLSPPLLCLSLQQPGRYLRLRPQGLSSKIPISAGTSNSCSLRVGWLEGFRGQGVPAHPQEPARKGDSHLDAASVEPGVLARRAHQGAVGGFPRHGLQADDADGFRLLLPPSHSLHRPVGPAEGSGGGTA